MDTKLCVAGVCLVGLLACAQAAAESALWVQLNIGPDQVQRVDQTWLDAPVKTSRLQLQAAARHSVRTAQTPWAVQVLDADDVVIEEIEIPNPLLIYTEYTDPAKAAADPDYTMERHEVRLTEGQVGLLIHYPEKTYRLRVVERQGEGRGTLITRGDVTLRRKP